ncbi:MAG: transcription antitermination factor NusB [Butyrivibrio sp.]
MKRTTLREHVFRILFRYEFYDTEEFAEQEKLYLEQYPEWTGDDRDELVGDDKAISELDRAEIESRVNDIAAHLEEIDEKISGACKGWKISRLGKAELSILRLAVYEIVYDDDVDAAVAINEAVELSKKYCDEKTRSFVNGVLAGLMK